MPDADWWRALWSDPEAVLRQCGLARGMSAIDLCCGDGWFTVPMCRMLGAGAVHGLDLLAEMIGAAKRAHEKAGAPACNWIVGDACRVDAMVPEKVDFVLIANTFHGAPDKTALAASAARALKPGGRLVIINWHAHRREETVVLGAPRGPATELRMTPQAVARAVEAAGLEAVEVVELPPFHYAAIFRRGGQQPS